METVFSGIQPSGELHLGNYLGAVRNWVAMQDEYHCFICIVDYHAITQNYDPETLAELNALRWQQICLPVGLILNELCCLSNPAYQNTLSLCWILNTVTPFGDLGRMTQFKDKSEKQTDNINAGLFSYPVLQTADIILYKATVVPVGADQLQHLELAREIVRRFNGRWGEYFPEPRALLSSTPRFLVSMGKQKCRSPSAIRSHSVRTMTVSAKNSRPPRLIPHGCDGKIRATRTFVIFTRCIHSSRTKSAFNGYGQVAQPQRSVASTVRRH